MNLIRLRLVHVLYRIRRVFSTITNFLFSFVSFFLCFFFFFFVVLLHFHSTDSKSSSSTSAFSSYLSSSLLRFLLLLSLLLPLFPLGLHSPLLRYCLHQLILLLPLSSTSFSSCSSSVLSPPILIVFSSSSLTAPHFVSLPIGMNASFALRPRAANEIIQLNEFTVTGFC